jgi:hypothetical protein
VAARAAVVINAEGPTANDADFSDSDVIATTIASTSLPVSSPLLFTSVLAPCLQLLAPEIQSAMMFPGQHAGVPSQSDAILWTPLQPVSSGRHCHSEYAAASEPSVAASTGASTLPVPILELDNRSSEGRNSAHSTTLELTAKRRTRVKDLWEIMVVVVVVVGVGVALFIYCCEIL